MYGRHLDTFLQAADSGSFRKRRLPGRGRLPASKGTLRRGSVW